MAAQAALVAETIAGMKRVISGHQYSSDSDNSLQPLTNRGNKLKRKAQFVQKGQLDIPSGPKVYKRKIEHAGHERYIISRNPRRYDEDGDELDDDEPDEKADADAAARNAYQEIRIEEILAPLTSAADLPNHPSLSVPYRSNTLTNMVQQACGMLHRERRTLSSVKHLLTQLRGDKTWIPCGDLNSEIDDIIFDTGSIFQDILKLETQPGLPNLIAQKPLSGNGNGDLRIGRHNFLESEADFQSVITHIKASSEISDAVSLAINVQHSGANNINAASRAVSSNNLGNSAITEISTEKVSASVEREGGDGRTSSVTSTAVELADKNESTSKDIYSAVDPDHNSSNVTSTPLQLGIARNEPGSLEMPANKLQSNKIELQPSINDKTKAPTDSANVSTDICLENNEEITSREEEDALLAGPHRMRTRAQAQAASEKAASSRTRSISPASWIPPVVHPLFLMPESARPDRDLGLPAGEAEEIRRMVMLFVQKQEEVCRGAERLYIGLLRADRMRKTVFKWCKAEGHVGEMSDGEDWYDKEEWGLDEDLRKGHDDEEDDATTQVKKTRGRRT